MSTHIPEDVGGHIAEANGREIGAEGASAVHRGTRIRLAIALVCLLIAGALLWRGGTRLPAPADGTPSGRVLFLHRGKDGRRQLASILPDGRGSETLTEPELDVQEYAVAPDQGKIALVAIGPDGPALWLLTLADRSVSQLLGCDPAACAGPTWAPDGRRLLYERRTFLPAGSLGPSQLWWIEIASGESYPLFSAGPAMTAARFSPDGRWLSYHLPDSGIVRFVDLQTGEAVITQSATNQPASWDAEGKWVLVSALQAQGDRFAENILRLNVAEGSVSNLTGAKAVSDGSPAWSPDGNWIAFNRRLGGAPMGRQLMVMRADGSDSRQLTQDAAVNHGPPRWSPDGAQLVYQRFVLAGGSDSAIWIIDLTTGAQRELAPVGAEPVWLP